MGTKYPFGWCFVLVLTAYHKPKKADEGFISTSGDYDPDNLCPVPIQLIVCLLYSEVENLCVKVRVMDGCVAHILP